MDRQSELRQNFFDYYLGRSVSGVNSIPIFQFEADAQGKVILPNEQNIFAEAERLRKRIIHTFRLRGTSGQFMEQARQAQVLSTKTVETWYEDDVGFIATYRILTSDERISNQEFLYLFQLTTTSALRFAMTHARWDGVLQYADAEEETSRKIAIAKRLFGEQTRVNLEPKVELVACYETPFYPTRLSLLVDFMRRHLREEGRYSSPQAGGGYTAQDDLARLELWDKQLVCFRESGFESRESLSEYSPIYFPVDKKAVMEILDQLQVPTTLQRKLMEEMAQLTEKGEVSIHDTILYLLGEQVTLDLLQTLQAWSNDNEPHLHFTG